MPVFWFALSQVWSINWTYALLVFFILHFLVYPASNGYNSYMDRDTASIGGIKQPLQPTRQLFYVTVIMDLAAIGLSFLITPLFAIGILLYILASRAYSYRKIRLKKYPITGYLTVVIFQGAVTFFLVYHGCEKTHSTDVPPMAMLAASLLIGGFYPLTQIYQHDQDLKDGVQTISYKLGYKGTFLFTGIVYALAFVVLGVVFFMNLEWVKFFILQLSMVPVIVFYFVWLKKVLKDKKAANYEYTMGMNYVATICSNIGFICILILRFFE